MSIPKLIHYVWVSNEMPEKHKKLLNINKQVLNNYQFILWNENKIFSEIANTKLEKYVNYAYSNKKFAFLSDAIKLYALHKYGGWAIDADVEILKPLDTFEEYNWVSGNESTNYPITATWGAIANHKFTNLLLEKYYDESNFHMLVTTPNTIWITDILLSYKAKQNNEYQYIKDLDVHIFPRDVFCASDNRSGYTEHHFTASWING